MANNFISPVSPAPSQSFFSSQKQEQVIPFRIEEQLSSMSGRMKLIEDRIGNMRNHLDIVDKSLIEKHKAVVSEIHDVEDALRSVHGDIALIKDLVERLAKRMESLASKEEFKILERYVALWQPLNYVTRSEAKSLVKSILKEQGLIRVDKGEAGDRE